MAVTTTDPKVSTTSSQTPKGGCCGGEATAEAKTDAASRAIRDGQHERAKSPEADKSSCCGGTSKESSVVEPKSRSAASK